MKLNKHGLFDISILKKKQSKVVNTYFCKTKGCNTKAEEDKLCKGYCGTCFMEILWRKEER